MKVVYFSRYVKTKYHPSIRGSSAEIVYFPDEKIAMSKLDVGEYELNTNKEILTEGKKILKDKKPYSKSATISDIKIFEADAEKIRELTKALKVKDTLQKKIDEDVEELFKKRE